MKQRLALVVLPFLFVLLTALPVLSQSVYVDKEGKSEKQVLSLPFGFYNESFGLAGAYVYGVVGSPQPQSALVATGMVGTKGSGMLALFGKDIRIPGTDRLFVDPIASVGFFGDNDAFIDGNNDYPNERAGANTSDKDNFVNGDGWDTFFRIRFEYVLPIGRGRDTIVDQIELDRGVPVDPPSTAPWWNPWTAGKTYLEVRPFYRWQQIDSSDLKDNIRTNGLDVGVFWDNRDFAPNPSQGHGLRLKASRDFGLFDSNNAWTVLQGELDQYFSLGESDYFRQQVIALDFWTAYSPSWNTTNSGIDNRPPAYTGATLGGLWRMRAYPTQRFSDRSAIYYSAEYRMMPKWNPFADWPVINRYLGIEWLQFVPFVEAGRVAPEYNVENLHSSMKWDAGVGLRAWAKGLVIRIDTAASDEGLGVQMMVSQPFQF